MLFLNEVEKYFWQTLIAIILGLPLIILTTSRDKIIWIVIYTLAILILGLIISIINRLIRTSTKNR